MPTTSARARSRTVSLDFGQTTPACPLSMECEDDELTSEQINFYNK